MGLLAPQKQGQGGSSKDDSDTEGEAATAVVYGTAGDAAASGDLKHLVRVSTPLAAESAAVHHPQLLMLHLLHKFANKRAPWWDMYGVDRSWRSQQEEA